jgi:hypothetical protein
MPFRRPFCPLLLRPFCSLPFFKLFFPILGLGIESNDLILIRVPTLSKRELDFTRIYPALQLTSIREKNKKRRTKRTSCKSQLN